jgi:hypothetical protein
MAITSARIVMQKRRLASRISDWTPHLRRTTADPKSGTTVGRMHSMLNQIAACGCYAAGRNARFHRSWFERELG